MAPEQWGGADLVGPETDVYALGVVAYQALSGRLPFVADSTGEYFRQHQSRPVPRLGEGFPPDLDPAIQCALDKHPRNRTPSALQLAKDLRRALRTSKREQIRTSAQHWFDECCPTSLLWGADVLEEALRSVSRETLGSLECMFLKDSQRRIRRARWVRRALVAVAMVGALGVVFMQIRAARQVSEATITQAELDQGRSALLHDEPEASIHLGRAYWRGEHSPSTAFMLARALQPRLAEQARLASTSGRMWSATFSPDGRQIVTTDDRAAQVWDAQTYRRTFVLFHGDTIYQALYSADGARIVTAGDRAAELLAEGGNLESSAKRCSGAAAIAAAALVAELEPRPISGPLRRRSPGAGLEPLALDALATPARPGARRSPTRSSGWSLTAALVAVAVSTRR